MAVTPRVLFCFFCAIVVNAAVLPHEDRVLNRIARAPSCWSCSESYGPPPPPQPYGHPPPPRFYTQQWSGFARNSDGTQQQVYSGAAAAADSGKASSGEAQTFSIASSSAGNTNQHQLGYKQSQYNTHTLGANENSGYGVQNDKSNGQYGNKVNAEYFPLNKIPSNDDAKQSFATGGNQGDNQKEYGSLSDNNSSKRGYFQSSSSSNTQKQFGGQDHYHSNSGAQNERGDANIENQNYSGSSDGSKTHQLENSQHNYVGGGNVATQSKSDSSSFIDNEQTPLNREQKPSEIQSSYGSSNNDSESSLSGALSLAAQGLQTSQQTQQQGCNTCGTKGSYAFSNAQSHSGSAIALSIGG